MILEEFSFVLERGCNWPLHVDVLLTTVDDRNVTEPEGDDAAGQDVDNVSAFVPVVSRCQSKARLNAAISVLT